MQYAQQGTLSIGLASSGTSLNTFMTYSVNVFARCAAGIATHAGKVTGQYSSSSEWVITGFLWQSRGGGFREFEKSVIMHQRFCVALACRLSVQADLRNNQALRMMNADKRF